MNLAYVPTYLSDVARQDDGYPRGISDASKRWLEAAAAGALAAGRSLPLPAVHDALMASPDLPDDCRFVLLDYSYAAVDRALRVVAVPVWTLKPEE